ncbi:hypothetical protein EGM97_17805 [Pseudomonas sp. AF32]|nr:hypothetical protein [Pseudomonas sp. AF32]
MGEKNLWERACGSKACSRLRRPIQHRCNLTHRYREQARSHNGLRCHRLAVTPAATATAHPPFAGAWTGIQRGRG